MARSSGCCVCCPIPSSEHADAGRFWPARHYLIATEVVAQTFLRHLRCRRNFRPECAGRRLISTTDRHPAQARSAQKTGAQSALARINQPKPELPEPGQNRETWRAINPTLDRTLRQEKPEQKAETGHCHDLVGQSQPDATCQDPRKQGPKERCRDNQTSKPRLDRSLPKKAAFQPR